MTSSLAEKLARLSSSLSDLFAPRGSTPLIILHTVVYGFVSAFYASYSMTYPNSAAVSLRHYLNESYVGRGSPEGLSHSAATWLWSLILNANFIGMFVGIPFVPYLTDNLGRRPSLLLGTAVQLIASCVDSLAMVLYAPELYLASRILGNGANAVVWGAVILVVIESAPTQLRGLCTFILGTQWTAGMVIGMILGMDVVIGNNLPLLAGAGILPSLIAFLMSFTLKETPKFLLSCKKPQPALDAFYYYQGLTGTEAEMAASETMKEMSNENIASMSFLRKLKDLFRQRHLRRAVFLGIASLELTIGVWSITTELLAVHFGQHMAQIYSSLLVSINFAAGIAGAFIIHRVSRRFLLIGSGAVGVVSLVSYVACDRVAVLLRIHYLIWGCLSAMMVSNIAFGIGYGTIAFYLSSELLPQAYRSLGQSLAFFLFTAVSFGANFLTLPAYETWDVWVFLPAFVAPQLVCIAYMWLRLPETRNREIHEIVEELMED